jgi:cation/acetate symporter
MEKWWGIGDISAGVFGIPAGFLTIVAVSLITAAPDAPTRRLVEQIRYPSLGGKEKTGAMTPPVE